MFTNTSTLTVGRAWAWLCNNLLQTPANAHHGARLSFLMPLVLIFASVTPLPLAANYTASQSEREVWVVNKSTLASRDRFMKARDALADVNLAEFEKHKNALTGYVLHPYLVYEGLAHEFRTSEPSKESVKKLNQFEAQYKDENLTRKLTRTLQSRLAETEQWSLFLGVSKSRVASGMPCSRLRADYELGRVKDFNEDVLELWVQPKKHHARCQSVLDALQAKKTPPFKAIWERVFLAMEEDKPEFAESMLPYFSRLERQQVSNWIKALEKPEPFLNSGAVKSDTQLNRRRFVDVVLAWSKMDPVAAMTHWLKHKDQYRFYKDRYYDTHRLLAMRGAYRRLPEAHEWLMGVPARQDDLELKEWRIRTALYAQDWPAVRKTIAALPQEEQEEDHWAYWEARALEEAGHKDHANKIYEELAGLQSYHGFLSADKLGIAYTLRDEPVAYEKAIVDKLKQEPALIRAREYHRVGVAWEGRREWNSVLSGSSPEELAAMAQIATQWRLHDRAIFAAGKAEQKRALSVRFPVSDNRIEPAWVFGVMRRESAYIPDVQSGAGARGLMQLMPNTAKYVAKLQGDNNWKGDLTDPQTNIGLGSHYLRHVMDKFDDHIVLATASYNAGPHRVTKWQPEEDMTADVWIDTIPFTETRRYVRAVLAYTAIYEWQLTGEAARMSDKLTVVMADPDDT